MNRATPGPWVTSGQYIAGGECITTVDGTPVAIVASNTRARGNAALIAAAPELREALAGLVRALESLPSESDPLMLDGADMHAARAALALAARIGH